MRDPLPWMEDIGTDIMDRVLAARGAYDPSSYTESDVRRAMCAEPSVEGFAALLSPAAEPLLEEIAARADLELEQAQKVVEILKAEFE